jgi:hypothetical protein
MKRGVQPRRLMAKVRKKFHRPTMEHTPKTVYNRNENKRETQDMIGKECTCFRMECTCGSYDGMEDENANG